MIAVAAASTHPERLTPEGRAKHREYNRRWKARNRARQAAGTQRWGAQHELERWCQNQVRSARRRTRITSTTTGSDRSTSCGSATCTTDGGTWLRRTQDALARVTAT